MENNPIQQSAGQSQTNGLVGQAMGLGYCAHCAPKCPYCGRPCGNYGYPYYQCPQMTCQAGISTMQSQANGVSLGGQIQ